jgi:hypothetical protein
MVIKESFALTATNSDIFAAPSRLSSIPKNGLLLIEISALSATAAHQFTVTLQTPTGDVPFEDLIVPFGGEEGHYYMDSRTQLTFSIPAGQGGHFLFSCTETGATTLFILATLTF